MNKICLMCKKPAAKPVPNALEKYGACHEHEEQAQQVVKAVANIRSRAAKRVTEKIV